MFLTQLVVLRLLQLKILISVYKYSLCRLRCSTNRRVTVDMSSPRSSKLIRTWSPQAEVNTHSAHLDAQPEAHDVNRGAIWFDDGTIILEVEGVHFRIYEGVLAIQSPLFQSLPYYLPVDAIYCERKIYDQPVLVLSDSQKDWTIALSVLFDPFEQRKL